MSAVTLASTTRPLLDDHDALLLDLDGVVQLDDQPVAHAPDVLAEVRRRNVKLAFLTNNASRPAHDVVTRLQALGVHAVDDEVVTSAMAAADVLAGQLAPGATVLVVGGAGLLDALARVKLLPVRLDEPDVAAVVQGWSPDVDWAQLAEGAVALGRGVPWVATNDDRTLPSPRGPLPGNGSLVAALVTATGRRPEVVGKPKPALFATAARCAGGRAPLVVGDRLDTDIAGARSAGLPSLLVLTGVATARDVLAAPEDMRPTYLGADLRALLHPQPEVEVDGGTARCGAATVDAGGAVDLAGADPLEGLRAAAALSWSGALGEDRFDRVVSALSLD